jgi:hypothetical protein
MSLELQIFLQRLLLPAFAAFLGCYMLSTTDQGEDEYDDEPVTGIAFRTLFGAFLCGVAMIASDLWHRGKIAEPIAWSEWKANYQWEWMVWLIPAGMLALAITRCCFSIPMHYGSIASSTVASLAIGVLFVCLNEGSVWQDQSAKVVPWFAAGLVAILWNTFAVNSIARSGGARWNTLIIMAYFGCIAAIVFQSYGSLGEWCLVGVGISAGASIVAFIKGSTATVHYGWQLSTVMVPMGVMATSCLVVSRFFESPEIPNWLLGCVLFLPSLVGVIDLLLGRIANPWIRALLAATVCGTLLGLVIYYIPPSINEW